MPTRGAATWRDGRLKGTTGDRDCRRLLDVLYTEDLFGPGAVPRAETGLDDGAEDTQLHYRITAHRAADVDRALAWLRTLPDRCARFPARLAGGRAQDVRVTGLALPEAGDARAGLRVTLSDAAAGDEADVLTVILAAVRVGDDAISLTYGGFGGCGTTSRGRPWRPAATGSQRSGGRAGRWCEAGARGVLRAGWCAPGGARRVGEAGWEEAGVSRKASLRGRGRCVRGG